MKTYRYSWKSLSLIITLVVIAVLIGIGLLSEKEYLYSLIPFSIGIGFVFVFLHYYKYRKRGPIWVVDDEGLTINLKGQRLYWSEIESIKLYSPKFFDTTNQVTHSTALYTKISAYKAIRIRFNIPYASECYLMDWTMIENARDFHNTVMEKWEASKQIQS